MYSSFCPLTVYPLPFLYLIAPTLLQTYFILQLLSCHHLDFTITKKLSIHLSFPRKTLRRKLHNEISASLIVLIKAVRKKLRKKLRKKKYSQQQGKTRVQWCVENASFHPLFSPVLLTFQLSYSLLIHIKFSFLPPYFCQPLYLHPLKYQKHFFTYPPLIEI